MHTNHINEMQDFKNCHTLYLKASERFDRKLGIVVNLENNYQTLLK